VLISLVNVALRFRRKYFEEGPVAATQPAIAVSGNPGEKKP